MRLEDRGLGIVARHSTGCVKVFRNPRVLGDHVVSLEGQAVFHALLAARRKGFDRVIVEMDSSIIYRSLVEDELACPWQAVSILHDTNFLRSSFTSCVFSLVPRLANALADWVAKMALGGTFFPPVDPSNCPVFARLILLDSSAL